MCLGCPPPPDPSCVAGPLRFERFLVPGERAEVTLGLAENCLNNDKPGFHTADEVTVKVRSNRKVA